MLLEDELGVLVEGWEFECCQTLPSLYEEFTFCPTPLAPHLREAVELAVPAVIQMEVVASDCHRDVPEVKGTAREVHLLGVRNGRYLEVAVAPRDGLDWVALVIVALP